MPNFRDYIQAMDIIAGDTEGDASVYLYLFITGNGIPGTAFGEIELPLITADGDADFGNQMIIPLELEVYASNATVGEITLPSLTVDGEAEILVAQGNIYLNLQVDGYMTFEPWGEITLPELQVDATGNPSRIYEICENTNQGI